MKRQIEPRNPMVTLKCAHPNCDNVIYRDTIDKDDAWRVSDGAIARYVCDMGEAHELADSNLYWDMALGYRKFETKVTR